MMKKLTLKNFDDLAKVLDENRNAKITDSHWVKAAKLIKRNNKRFKIEENMLMPTLEDMHRPFGL